MQNSDVKNAIEEILAQIESNVRVKRDILLKELTTMRVGGPAPYLMFVKDRETLLRLISMLNFRSIPWRVIGKGSNILAEDRGFEGVLITLEGEFLNYKISGQSLKAGAALRLSQLMSICLKEGLTGLEFLVGIPGTVGGAVKMNAGAFSKEVKDLLLEVEWASPKGYEIVKASSLSFGYRESNIPHQNIITYATFGIEKASSDEIRARLKDYLQRRKSKQPVSIGSMGSVFKNPPGDYAGRLIQQAGLKGTKIGGAYVSEKHANFILNDGTATSDDVWKLIQLIKSRVKETSGITLELEVHTLA